ncbi:anthranilate synthase component I family protein [Desulfatirhabdium butyrativorans]|uniref:anthranilate synthase component I family protein n=1 Tax=Desulfatirhabdium butyrativorans TaxID=340467 RepID=UPI0003F54883|nr:chorismate-binding protein [Desulfatirhabdium butyrativorans]
MLLRHFPDRAQFLGMADHCTVLPRVAEILGDLHTPVTLLSRFDGPDRPVFLFESVEGGERWGRYSFMGVSARYELHVFADRIEIVDKNDVTTRLHEGNPMPVLRDFMRGFSIPEMTSLPRFWGGLVGYLNYEMVQFFEKIPCHTKPDEVIAHFIVPDALIVFDNVRHTIFAIVLAFLADSGSAEDAFRLADERLADLVRRIDAPAPPQQGPQREALSLEPVYPRAHFLQMVQTVLHHIREGEVIQAVISQPFRCPAPRDPFLLYRMQRFVNPSPYLFFMRLGGTILIGSSPETMVRLENGQAVLRPIAGTRPRGATEQQDRAYANELLADEKEKAEHLMLVDLGRNDLGRVAATGTVQVTDLMFVERYSHVMHLVSNIQAELKPGLDAYDLLQSCFPAGTLSGAPKIRAMQIIAELEPDARGPYGGAVGYISFQGNMDFAITIRTAIIRNDTLIMRAGAGIVADSNPETEYQETINKSMAIQKGLQWIRPVGASTPHSGKEGQP